MLDRGRGGGGGGGGGAEVLILYTDSVDDDKQLLKEYSALWFVTNWGVCQVMMGISILAKCL